MFKTMLKGVNKKSMIITTLVVFVFIVITDMIIHGFLLRGLYQASPQIWRPMAEMQSKMGWMILSELIIAKFFTMIFIKGYEGKGIREGARFGFLAWGFMMGATVMQYYVYPLTCEIVGWWTLTSLVQYVLAGMLAAKVYKMK